MPGQPHRVRQAEAVASQLLTVFPVRRTDLLCRSEGRADRTTAATHFKSSPQWTIIEPGEIPHAIGSGTLPWGLELW